MSSDDSEIVNNDDDSEHEEESGEGMSVSSQASLSSPRNPVSDSDDPNTKLENLYPYSETNQKFFIEKNPNTDWSFIYFANFGQNCKQRFDLFKQKFETFTFITGLKYEFGYENTQKNLEKAFKIYKEAADKTNDYLCMYKMYVIYLKEYKKFNVKSNKILEIFYLAKCITFLPFSYIDFARSLCQIDPIFELALHFDQEDANVEKFFKLLNLLKNNKDYNIDKDILTLMKIIISYQFEVGDYKVFDDLEDLSKKGNLEATYKYACLLLKEETTNDIVNKYFEICLQKKYYRAYADYGKFLFYNLSEYDKALSILEEGCKNGCYECFSLYYDIYAFQIDFKKLEVMPEIANEYVKCLQYLIDSIATGQVFDIIEVFSFKNIFVKHYGMANVIENLFQKYIDEIIAFLKEVSKNDNYLKKYSSEELGLFECIRSLALIYVSGNDKNIKKDNTISLKLLDSCFKLGNSSSNKAYTFSLIYKIHKQQFKEGKLSRDELESTKVKLFNLYDSRLSDKNLNHSFFYYIGKLYQYGIGTKQNELTAFIFYEEAVTYEKKNINYSIVSYYRKYKSTKVLNSELFNKIKANFNKECEYTCKIEDGDDKTCNICFGNSMDIIFFPCLHKMCNICYEKIKSEEKCPFCRGKILKTKKLRFINKNV